MNYIGKTLMVDFGMARATLRINSETSLTFRILEKDGQTVSTSETVSLKLISLRPDLCLLCWQEQSGVTVSQVHDYSNGAIHSIWTTPGAALQQFSGSLKVTEAV
ncbi:hypothetical protein C7T94_13955 [Pedobacter yulinensis]|uniref:MoaF-like domain-containing protein n=1 Tax=Pedobacter yulinensis TaxID=2126353 RepID=A0A2T3HMH8_9SPHI|nr:hypothetical protein [Pedobacter yulinensis]PST83636.1 hypothetical protein C7T94_13955 [Pedobacter yulinensis]